MCVNKVHQILSFVEAICAIALFARKKINFNEIIQVQTKSVINTVYK